MHAWQEGLSRTPAQGGDRPMINYIWGALVLLGIVSSLAGGKPGMVVEALTDGSLRAVELGVKMLGAIMLWTGLIQVADDAGLTKAIARALQPVARRLFVGVPPGDPAMGAILMALSANVLGLGNAATPLGLKAMKELQRLNAHPQRASPAMCTLLALCTSSITMVPTGVIALRAAAGAAQPADILVPTLFATTYSTLVALVADAYLRARHAGAGPVRGRAGVPGPWLLGRWRGWGAIAAAAGRWWAHARGV